MQISTVYNLFKRQMPIHGWKLTVYNRKQLERLLNLKMVNFFCMWEIAWQGNSAQVRVSLVNLYILFFLVSIFRGAKGMIAPPLGCYFVFKYLKNVMILQGWWVRNCCHQLLNRLLLPLWKFDQNRYCSDPATFLMKFYRQSPTLICT